MILHTKRLILRCPENRDLDDMFAFFSNPVSMRYWSTAPHASRADTQLRIDRMRARFVDHPTYFCFEYEGRVIGCGGLVPPNEVGFILHPDVHRQGFGSEAMTAILDHVWATTEVDHVIADVDPRNDASQGLLKSLGFVETHRKSNTFCIEGEWSDSIYFALQRPS